MNRTSVLWLLLLGAALLEGKAVRHKAKKTHKAGEKEQDVYYPPPPPPPPDYPPPPPPPPYYPPPYYPPPPPPPPPPPIYPPPEYPPPPAPVPPPAPAPVPCTMDTDCVAAPGTPYCVAGFCAATPLGKKKKKKLRKKAKFADHEKDLAAGETKVEEAVNNKKVADGDDEDHAESAEKIVQEALAKGKENEEKKKKEEKKEKKKEKEKGDEADKEEQEDH